MATAPKARLVVRNIAASARQLDAACRACLSPDIREPERTTAKDVRCGFAQVRDFVRVTAFAGGSGCEFVDVVGLPAADEFLGVSGRARRRHLICSGS